MDADYAVDLKWPFVIGEEELKKLSGLLAERIGAVQISAECTEGINLNFPSLAALLKFENPKASNIRRLRITARSEDHSKRATISLSDSQWRGVSLDFHARDDVVDRLRSDVLDIVSGMRPWYSGFHRVDFFWVSFGTLGALVIGLLTMIAFKHIPSRKSSGDEPSSALGQLIGLGAIAVFALAGVLLNRFRDRVFPRAVFLIGQGKSRYQHLERFQWGVIIAFPVSFLAGLVIWIWQLIA